MTLPIEFEMNDAGKLLVKIGEAIIKYGFVSIADLYHLARIDNESSDTLFLNVKEYLTGWDCDDILNMRAIPLTSGQFAIVLPEPHSIMGKNWQI